MKKMSPEDEREFEELAGYVGFFATTIWGVAETSSSHPSRHLGAIPGKVTKSQRLSGLRQAARDTAEASRDFSLEQVAALDAACEERQLITLTEVRRRYSGRRLAQQGAPRDVHASASLRRGRA
ncbi:MAG: hypothetical protein ACPGJF_10540 [Sinimarinibacterium flocculans]|uniref:hypothetical protein n=1 Tax=Sinimarinibacterium flocculans TaxID=985250 RepID=UPI003C594DA5